jgi:hypothetical protein
VVKEGLSLPDQEISGEIREIEFDEMWHFIESKKQNLGNYIFNFTTTVPPTRIILFIKHSNNFVKRICPAKIPESLKS